MNPLRRSLIVAAAIAGIFAGPLIYFRTVAGDP